MHIQATRRLTRRVKALSAAVGASSVVGMAAFGALGMGSQAAASTEPVAPTITRIVETTLKVTSASPTYTATPCGKRQTMPCG